MSDDPESFYPPPPVLPPGYAMPMWLTDNNETVMHLPVGQPSRPMCDFDNDDYKGRLASLPEVQHLPMCEECRHLMIKFKEAHERGEI